MDVRMPDGTIIQNVPDGMSQSELLKMVNNTKLSSPDVFKSSVGAGSTPSRVNQIPGLENTLDPQSNASKEKSIPENIDPIGDFAIGALSNVGRYGSMAMYPLDKLGLTGRTNADRIAAINDFQRTNSDANSIPSMAGSFAADVAKTGGVGNLAAKGVSALAPQLIKLPAALASFGGTVGSTGSTIGEMLANAGIRGAAGATTGAMAGALSAPEFEKIPESAGTVALLGGILPAGGELLAKTGQGAGWLYDASKGNLGKIAAGRIGRDAAGDSLDAIRAANASAPSNLTASQAASGITAEPYQALANVAGKHDQSSFYGPKSDAQKLADTEILQRMAKGASSEDSALSRDFFIKQAEGMLGPKRTAILSKLAEPGQELSTALPQLSDFERRYVSALREGRVPREPMPGIANTEAVPLSPSNNLVSKTHPSTESAQSTVRNQEGKPGWISNADRSVEWTGAAQDFKDVAKSLRGEADALRQKVSELPSAFTIAPILEHFQSTLASPVTQMNTAKTTVFKALTDKLQAAGNDPVAIAELRKVGVNELIGDLIQTGKVSKSGAASALVDAKKLIDKQLGTDFVQKYLEPYSAKLAYRDSLEAANELRSMYQNQPEQFLKVVKGDVPDFVEKYSSTAKTVQELFGDKRFSALKDIANRLERDKNLSTQAERGTGGLQDIVNSDSGFIRLPHLISKWFAATNQGVSMLEGKVSKQTIAEITKGMRSGQSANEMLAQVPISERNEVLKWIKTNSAMKPLGIGANGLLGASKDINESRKPRGLLD